jgi:hypothetical protein
MISSLRFFRSLRCGQANMVSLRANRGVGTFQAHESDLVAAWRFRKDEFNL